jgi:exosortase/archaeosortase family protein
MGCDALQSAVFLMFAVVASPLGLPLRSRVPFIILGTLFLLGLNLVRIISLYYTGVYWKSAFETIHIDVWQPVFIFVPLVMWVIWARRAMIHEAAK